MDQFPPYPGDLLHLERFRAQQQPYFAVEPARSTAVVLGCGTPSDPDLRLDRCLADGIPVYRRRGGGGAVVLAPGVVVITGCFPAVPGRFPDAWAKRLVSLVGKALAQSLSPAPGCPLSAVPRLFPRGLGDLCFLPPGSSAERKVLGSSLYLAKDVVLYQASLLYRADLSLLPRYLGPPSRPPDYRRGRDHLAFVANLPAGCRLAPDRLEVSLNLLLAALLAV
ncbi:MAG TPA: hypothetical protein GXX28_08525 [Firmicutes bacterium]|nr:hypothetical protein [Bacillota bacterium]